MFSFIRVIIENLRFDFSIQVDPVIVQAPRDVEIHIDEIDSYESRPLFECQAVGHPLPVIEWFRNGLVGVYNISCFQNSSKLIFSELNWIIRNTRSPTVVPI